MTQQACFGEWHIFDNGGWFRYWRREGSRSTVFRLAQAPFWEIGNRVVSLEGKTFTCVSCGRALPDDESLLQVSPEALPPVVHTEVTVAREPRGDGGPDSVELVPAIPEAAPFLACHDEWVGDAARAFAWRDVDGLRIYGIWGSRGRARLEEKAEPLGDGLWRYRFWLRKVPDSQRELLP